MKNDKYNVWESYFEFWSRVQTNLRTDKPAVSGNKTYWCTHKGNEVPCCSPEIKEVCPYICNCTSQFDINDKEDVLAFMKEFVLDNVGKIRKFEHVCFSDPVPKFIYVVTDMTIRRKAVAEFVYKKGDGYEHSRILDTNGGQHEFEKSFIDPQHAFNYMKMIIGWRRDG